MNIPPVPALPSPGVLLFNLPPERERPVRQWLLRHDVTVRTVRPDEQRHSLGYLTGMPGRTPAAKPDGTPFTDEMLVMSLFPGTLMDEFLAFFRTAGLEPVALKAVVTPSNASWSAVRLHRELKKEHRTLS